MPTKCLRWYPIQIQRRDVVEDTVGGQSTAAWTSIIRAKATVEPKQGRERERGDHIENPVIFEIRMRYQSGVTGGMRVLFKNRPLNIRSVINEGERNRWLKIRAEEAVEGTT